MNEFEKYFKDEFFIIDSNNLDSINDKIYGYAIQNNEIVSGDDVDINNLNGSGAYIHVKVTDDEIKVFQDYVGSYGLYLYEDEDYFALSNSFLKLLEHLKYEHDLSFNQDYANSLMMRRLLCSFSFDETLVNEITYLPRDVTVKISKSNFKVELEKEKNNDFSIDLNSSEALDVLDRWYSKWTGIFRNVKQKTNRIYMDLSGGFDTRIVLALALGSNIDLNSITVNSITDDKHSHKEDFEIATEIADEYNFKLNQQFKDTKKSFKDIGTVISLSSYLKLGITNQFNYKYSYHKEPIYVIGGAGGGSIRGFPVGTMEKHKNYLLRKSREYNRLLEKSVERIASSGIEKINSNNSYDENELNWQFYRHTRLRNHFGKSSVEQYLVNRFVLSPLIDPELYKLKLLCDECEDSQLLMTLIFVRYCPNLLKFRIQGGRKFNEETIEFAKKINQLKPFTKPNYEKVSEVKEENFDDEKAKFSADDINKYFSDVFKTNAFEHEFKKYINPDLYEKIRGTVSEHSYFPIRDILPVFSIIKVQNAIETKSSLEFNKLTEWFDLFLNNKNCKNEMTYENRLLLKQFATARIEICNPKNKKGKIKLLDISDLNSDVSVLEKGKALMIHSTKGKLNIKIKCIRGGQLNVNLKGMHINNADNENLPVYIDFNKFQIGEDIVFDKSKLLCYGEAYSYSQDVKGGEILDLYFEWMPINEKSDYVSQVKIMEWKLKEAEEENKRLKSELENYKSKGFLSKLKRKL